MGYPKYGLSLLIIILIKIHIISADKNVTYEATESTVTVRWDESTFTNQATQNVSITLKNGGIVNPQQVTISDFRTKGSYEFNGLSANTVYTLEVTQFILENGNIDEVTQILAASTSPAAPTGLNWDNTVFRWTPGPGSPTQTYKFIYTDLDSNDENFLNDLSEPNCVITDLVAGTKYQVIVYAQANGHTSEAESLNFITKPLQPTIKILEATGTQSLKLVVQPASQSRQDTFSGKLEKEGDNSVNVNLITCTSFNLGEVIMGGEPVTCNLDVNSLNQRPGQAYTVTVTANREDQMSNAVSQVATTKPLPPAEINVVEITMNRAKLIVSPPATSIFNTFKASVTDGATAENFYQHNAKYEAWIQQLNPGTMYTVTVKTVSGMSESEGVDKVFYAKPTQTTLPTLQSVTQTTITIKLTTLEANMRYKISVQGESAQYEKQVSYSDGADVLLDNLQPGYRYTINVAVITPDNQESSPRSVSFYTKPKPVLASSISLKDRSESSLTIAWERPSGTGNSGYTVRLNEYAGSSISTTETSRAFTTLTAGTEYTFVIMTYSGDQNRQTSIEVSKKFRTVPSAPFDVTVTKRTNTSLTISWKKTGTPDGFKLSLTDESNTLVGPKVVGDLDTYLWENLSPGTLYDIEVYAYNGPEMVLSAASRQESQATKPNAPNTLQTTTKTTTEATVIFSRPHTGDFDGYRIKAQNTAVTTDTRGPFTKGKSDTTHTFTSLSPGTMYKMEILAYRGSIESLPKMLYVQLIPRAPISFGTLFRGANQIEITWLPPPTGSYDGYRVSYRKTGSGTLIKEKENVDGTSYAASDLQPLTTYIFYIYSTSGTETSEALQSSANTKPGNQVSLTVASVARTEITVTWSKPINQAIDGYGIRITGAGQSGTEETLEESVQTYTFRNLVPGSTYVVEIHLKSGGDSGQWQPRSITTKPNHVKDLTAEVTQTSMNLNWQVEPQGEQTEFEIVYKLISLGVINTESRKSVRASGTSLQYSTTLENLTPGGIYEMKVTAKSGEVKSAPVTINKTTVPLPVMNLQPDVKNSTHIVLTWEKQENSLSNQYICTYLYINRNNGVEKIERTDGYKLTLSSLFPGERYAIGVQASSNGVKSSSRDIRAVTFPLSPSAVSVVAGSTTSSKFNIRWTYETTNTFVLQWKITYGVQGTSDLRTLFTNSETSNMAINGLLAGHTYTVNVYGVTSNAETSKQPTTIHATVKPILTSVIKEETAGLDRITVSYTRNEGLYEMLRFRLMEGQSIKETKNKVSSEPSGIVEFESLTPGIQYKVHLRAVSQNQESNEEQIINVVTKPSKPIVTAKQGPSYIELVISNGRGGVDTFIVTCVQPCGNNSHTRIIQYNPNGPSESRYGSLVPDSTYVFDVVAVKGSKRSDSTRISRKTEFAPPGPVSNFAVENIKTDSLTLTWSEPLEKNGELDHYALAFTGTKQGKPDHVEKVGNIPLKPRRRIVENLRAGYTYTFTIRAWNIGKLEGKPAYVEQTTPIKEPYFHLPKKESVPQLKEKNKNAVTFELINPFSSKNGEIVGYTVIVRKAGVRVNVTGQPKTWKQVSDSDTVIYQATPQCDIFEGQEACKHRSKRAAPAINTKVDFTVGTEDCSDVPADVYCNGPLEAGESYSAMLRGFTENGHYSDTPFSAPVQTDPADGFPLWVIAIILLLVIAVLVGVFLFLFLRRRRGQPTKKARDVERDSKGLDINLFPKSNREKGSSRPIKVEEFESHFNLMSADSDFRFSEEYEDLKHVGRDQCWEAADLPINRPKNRFTNILPYDVSRVRLLPAPDDEDGSDYINANYMPGYKSKREYICTQGPLEHTQNDFWRMIWEQNTRIIVMLTRCVEKGRDKCYHYWPKDTSPLSYGDLQVAVHSENKQADWVITELKITKGETIRTVKHYHYTAWPDFGVPDRTDSPIKFVKLVRSELPTCDSGPIVVHCSAGVGRSGTFIVLDRSFQCLQVTDKLDIFRIVHQMRHYRMFMVQTEQQYVWIHKCINCVIKGEDDDNDENDDESIGEDNMAFEAVESKPTHQSNTKSSNTVPSNIKISNTKLNNTKSSNTKSTPKSSPDATLESVFAGRMIMSNVPSPFNSMKMKL